MKNKVLTVLAGPTASGKTKTAISIAKHFNTAIISADSRQFYKEMTIGTAAPTADELSEAPHYMVGNISIFDEYTVADYESDVLHLLDTLFKEHDIVILTGGSGLFIDAVCNGIDLMPEVSKDTRAKVSALLEEHGIAFLQNELERLDPVYYSTVDRMNPRRLQRALEICCQTGKPFSSFRLKKSNPRDFGILKLAIGCDRDELIKRINARVDAMIENGLVEEAKGLYPHRDLNPLNTVGYKEMFCYFDGDSSLEEAIEQIKISTRQYAKRQMTWFRKDPDYKWFDMGRADEMIGFVEQAITSLNE